MRIRGVVHCHSDLSYDCTTPIEQIRDALRREGFRFVALSEHTEEVSPDAYLEYVEACDKLSDASFLVLPGLEIRCTDNGHELLAFGLRRFLADGLSSDVVGRIKQAGAFCVLPHPWKHGCREFVEGVEAVEILNGKVDGVRAPSLALTRFFYQRTQTSDGPYAVFGADAHSLDKLEAVFVECDVDSISSESVLDALKRGRFANHTCLLSAPAIGRPNMPQRCWHACCRAAYVFWNLVVPEAIRGFLDRAVSS